MAIGETLSHYTHEERELFYLLYTEPKQIKVRKVIVHPDRTFNFSEIAREGRVINFSQDEFEFVWASHVQAVAEHHLPHHPLSNVYWDFRYPEKYLWLPLLGKILAEVPLPEEPLICTGIPTTGEHIAKSFANACLATGRNIEYRKLLQKKPTPDGKYQFKACEEAIPGQGESIIVNDDVISYGTNGIPALHALVDLGYHPVGLLTTIDHEKGGARLIQKAGFQAFSWRKASEVYQFLFQEKTIDHLLYERLIGLKPRNNIFENLKLNPRHM